MLDYQSINTPNTTETTTKSNKNKIIGCLVIGILLVILGYWGYENIITNNNNNTNKHLLQENMNLQPAEMTDKPTIQTEDNIINPDFWDGATFRFSPAGSGLYLTSVGNGNRVVLQSEKTNNDLLSQVWTYWSSRNTGGGKLMNGLYGGTLLDSNGVLITTQTTASYYTFRFDNTYQMYRLVNINTHNCLGPSSVVDGSAFVIEYYNYYFCHNIAGLWTMSSWSSFGTSGSDISNTDIMKKNIVKPQASIKSLTNLKPMETTETTITDYPKITSILPDSITHGGQYLIRPYVLSTTYLTSIGNDERVQLKTLQNIDFISQVWAFWKTKGNTGKLNNGLYGGWLLDSEGILETSMSGPTYYTLEYDTTYGLYRIVNQETNNCLGPTSSNDGITYVFEYFNRYFCHHTAGYWIITAWTP